MVGELRDKDKVHDGRFSASRIAYGIAVLATLVFAIAHIAYMCFVYDDAYISFRYADNAVQGHGLVYNPGERVEGYSNFLWTLLMALVIQARGSPEFWAPVIGAVFALGTLLLVMDFARQRGMSSLLVGILLAANCSWATWATGGLETAMFAALTTFGTLILMSSRDKATHLNARMLDASALAFGLACLTRPDGPLIAASAGLIVIILTVRGKLRPWQTLRWAGIVGGLVACHVGWRLAYYGALLANTFAVKGPAFSQLGSGWRYLADAVMDLHLELLLIPLILAVFLQARHRGWTRRDIAVAAAVVLPFVLYVATTGGDFMPVFRFVAPLLPLVTLGAVAALEGLSERMQSLGLGVVGRALVALVAVTYITLNLHYSWRQQGIWQAGHLVSVGYSRHETAGWLRTGDLLRHIAQPTDTLAVTAAGAVPYRSRLHTIDLLGLNAPNLSRFRRLGIDRPGHLLWMNEQWLDEHPPQIFLATPLVHPTPATLTISANLRPEWHDRVLSHYDLVGLTLLGEPPAFVGCGLRHDVVDRFLAAGARLKSSATP